ncbi:tRNA methyltransferase complex GCD14 subunit [Annulohypoxylon maeteangense]|uniref:tRNA methyltransferase complex GCD14 subunit n=1 Tax=Annulohypoxylon maeteangense TaxID=1927788 RepID=UPI0020081F45|nr:tRNA methyltransferase complex GCD14 subunit [Annulohypoxylon maeteangense]KAI0884390.1 tRNA methyltransferase complex GCD14 subunit [Annulohypoxylon maeteangense]
MSNLSPFLNPGPRTKPNTLALAHLSRDNIEPIYLNDTSDAIDGYAEGAVLNTRFGSFPHSTLLNKPWGSQIRASVVDTGSRGRKLKPNNDAEPEKEPENDVEDAGSGVVIAKDVKTASSGFIHILPPTPELWTTSLPHRTQVVYTPDYSYILHRIRARPGMKIIEAGAGSGSFTHAAARAIYNGYPKDAQDARGKVFSFEYNQDRYEKMRQEISDHRLDKLVQITHRDVYNNGFLVDGESPEAECVFLDLPAPWKALPHLSRQKPTPSQLLGSELDCLGNTDSEWKSPLHAGRTVYICTFSPCIEQVTKTIDVMRRLGWMDIEMVEVAHKKILVMRERIGLNIPAGERGSSQTAANVTEAITKLKEIEGRFKNQHPQNRDADVDMDDGEDIMVDTKPINGKNKRDSQTDEAEDASSIKPWMAGRLIHRTEPELKTHTSYLVFAVLPQEWSEAQEAAAFANWPCGNESKVIGSLDKEARKKEKREMLQGKKRKKDPNNKSEGGRASSPKKSKAS